MILTARPQILFLVHRIPYPPNRGDRIRSWHLLEHLAAQGDVRLGFLCEEPPSAETMAVLAKRCAEVEAVVVPRRLRWVRGAWRLASGRSATEGLFEVPSLKRTVRRWAQKRRFDLAVVFCSSMVQYVNTPALREVPVLVDLVDVDSQKWFDYAEQTHGPRQWLYRLEGGRLRRLETAVVERARGVVLVSRPEVELLRRFCRAENVHPIGNGVNLDYFQPSVPPAPETAARCVFTGAMNYRANVDGVVWFCEEVWPELKRRCPQASFEIVGGQATAAVERLAYLPGVSLAGDVPDVRPHVAQAAVAVAPLRIARGIQNKVLEAAAMAKAIVGSPQSLEGLDLEPDVHVCRAGTPEAWVETLQELFADGARRQALGQAARRQVEDRYRWQTQLQGWNPLLGLASPESAAPRNTTTVATSGPVQSNA